MIQHWKRQILRRLRNSEAGQSILLLALGFIALAAFVGLVTDISIMFVRFATLRRAVDAAAIAASGQIREGTDYSTVALSARQYITLHGLQPHRVWVETCETDIAEWREDNPAPSPLPANYSIADHMPETELCDWDRPRKLVRVTAQIDSETTFLRLIGINDFVITSSATSETAALDIVLVLDTSDSMAKDTRVDDFEFWGMRDYQVTNDAGNWAASFQYDNPAGPRVPYWCGDATPTVEDDNADGPDPDTYSDSFNHDWPGCCNDPAANAFVYQDEVTKEWKIYTDGVVTGGANGSRFEATSRFVVAPPTWSVSGANGEYDAGEEGLRNSIPDGRFDDVICQPFKQIKDAARNFIQRLDFIRGDRLGLVMFNRLAEVVYPNNDSNGPPMMVSEEDSMRTLDQYVGVYTNLIGERSGCLPDEIATANANDRAIDGTETYVPGSANVPWRTASNPYLASNRDPYSYDTQAQCPNTNVGDALKTSVGVLSDPDVVRRDSVWVTVLLSDGAANASTISHEAARDKAHGGPLAGQDVSYGDFGFCPWYTFCYFRPNTAANRIDQLWYDRPVSSPDFPDPLLIDPNEVFTKWNEFPPPGMDYPMQRGVTLPFMFVPSYDECNDSYSRLSAAEQANYFAANAASGNRLKLCNDGQPNTRHFCLTWGNTEATRGIPEGVTYNPNTREYTYNIPLSSECSRMGRYDADDYARDWADFTGLVTVAPGVPGSFIAIFTIGFGSELSTDPTAAPLMRYIADAGDNGFIDNNLEEDWRDNKVLNGNITGENDPCFGVTDPKEWCGQYYYAENLTQLDAVFEAIAGRLFTRISR